MLCAHWWRRSLWATLDGNTTIDMKLCHVFHKDQSFYAVIIITVTKTTLGGLSVVGLQENLWN